MELSDILQRCRMVRSYPPDALPDEVVGRIAATVRRAPSAGFSQGHRLVVVTARHTRSELARLAGEGEHVGAGGQAWISTAPVHVFVGMAQRSCCSSWRRSTRASRAVTIGRPAPDPRETALVSRRSQRRLGLDELVRRGRWSGTP